MGLTNKRDERGIAALAIIGIIVLVVAVAGVGYMVYSKNQKKDTVSQAAKELVVANAAAEKACKELYNDEDLCKFASTFNPSATSSKGTFVSKSADGKTTVFVVETDKNGNSSSVSKDGDTENYAAIYLNGDTYVKDYSDNTWIKYPKNENTATTSNPSDDVDIDFTEEASKPEESRIT